MAESRVKKTFLNARMNLTCYGVSLLTAFFTRKIFIDNLGAEFIGLTSTFESMLSFLNLAELGVGSAIAYVLYAPILQKDRGKINEIVSLLGYMYRNVGLFILGAGVLLSLFIPLMFGDAPFSLPTMYAGFYVYLAASLLGYFANYRAALLSADQRNYIVTGYYQLTKTVKAVLQMTCAIYVASFLLYFAIELAFGIINSLILNWKINKTYPWLDSEISRGKALFKEYPEVWKNVKRLFIHNTGGVINSQLSPLMIFSFVSLPMVTLYTNYTIIINNVKKLVNAVLGSTAAGIGNLIAEGNRRKTYDVFCELYTVRFLILGILSLSIFQLATPFVSVWLGGEYRLSQFIVLMIVLQFFWDSQRSIFEQFLHGYGLFADIWVPMARIGSVAITALFGYLWGLEGILASPLLFLLTIICIWKPYYLYTQGLRMPVVQYVVLLVRNIAAFVLPWCCAWGLSLWMGFTETEAFSWGSWICYAAVFAGTLSATSVLSFVICFPCMRRFLRRFIKNKQK